MHVTHRLGTSTSSFTAESCLLGLVACVAIGLFGCADAQTNATTAATRNHVSIPIRTYSQTLPNGMHLVVDEDHRSPVVSLNLS